MPPVHATNQRIVDRLLADNRVSADEHRTVVGHATRHRARVEDALVELGILSEADLLKFIATVHSTRFVSTEKLAKAVIDPRVIAKVSRKTAELHNVFPVLFEEQTKTLSVVTADPDNGAALDEVRLMPGVKDVKALLARPAAVRAAIARAYHGDSSAFNSLLRGMGGSLELLRADPFDRSSHTLSAPPPQPQPPPQPPPQPQMTQQMIAAPIPTPPPAASPRSLPPRNPTPPPEPVVPPTASHEFVEMLNVLVSLLENSRQDLRGHSSTVARLMRKTCERIGLNPAIVSAFVSAAYLHDLGKFGAYHLTALNVSEYEGHRIAALKVVEVPAHMMQSIGLPAETLATISAMYERYDGQGFPNGQAGKEIPLGARILSVVDTYADLTQNPRNPYRKILRPIEACEVLEKYRGGVFDPNIVDLFRQAMTGDDMRAKLLADRHQALIIDPDPEETTILELRLIEQGFEVKIARTAAQAKREIQAGEIAVVISEIDLEEPDFGLTLRSEGLEEGWARDITWVVLTSRSDRQSAQRAFDLGVDDFVSKPAATDIFVAKLRQLIERRAAQSGGRGVSGSLAEMSLPDMVQILWHGRKTCALKIQALGSSGEIHFAEGHVVDARWNAIKGEDAFYKMLTLTQGDFRLDPNFKPGGVQTINASPEALLLEGMRRLDEGSIVG